MNTPEKDQHLIALLQENARMPVSEIARHMSVSRTAAQMRLQKLERNGVIDGYTVRVSSEFLKNRVRALVMIKFPPGVRTEIESALSNISQLTALYSISGIYDFSAEISAGSVGELDKVIDTIGQIDGIEDTLSSIVLSTKFERKTA